jgi:hypothetical protein
MATKHLNDAPPANPLTPIVITPPRYGLGSTLAAWTNYATTVYGMTLPTGLTRNQVVALLQARGMPVAQVGGTATIATDAAVNGDLDASTTP